jgi:DhnA family fructose-bisphosphate aldolase class Ia
LGINLAGIQATLKIRRRIEELQGQVARLEAEMRAPTVQDVAYDRSLADRVRHVVQSAFDGRRIVIFSGGAKKDDEEAVLDEIRQIRDGGGFDSTIGRNVFKREKGDALRLLDRVIQIYRAEAK